MYKNLILLFCLLCTHAAFAKTDTTIVEFNDKALKKKIIVYSNDKSEKTIEIPKSLNLENLLKQIGVDSTERNRIFVLVNKSGDKQDTLIAVSKEGNKIKIVTKENLAKKDTSIQSSKPQIEEEIETEKEKEPNLSNLPKTKKSFFSKSDFGIYLGLNSFLNENSQSPNSLYTLRTGKSRYVALSFRKNLTISKSEKLEVALSYAPEFAWYNFMFENNNVASYQNGQVSFIKNSFETQKSKLVKPFFNFPVLINFGFKESKFKFGIGSYVGYRLGGYTKTKDLDGDKLKTKGKSLGDGLSDFSYGLTTEFGKRNGFTLFVRYDMNDLFKANQLNAKDLQAVSFGVRI
jgi:hypothetical protein